MFPRFLFGLLLLVAGHSCYTQQDVQEGQFAVSLAGFLDILLSPLHEIGQLILGTKGEFRGVATLGGVIAWKVKVSLLYRLEKSQPVLGASRVSMAQGLPKAGEGPG